MAKALLDPDAASGAARTIARNIEAMREAIAIGERAELTVDHLLDIHRTLMQDEPEALPGEFRATQGWIGGRAASSMGAAYIPPPEDRVPCLADDLLQFMARDDIPPIAMAAISALRPRVSLRKSAVARETVNTPRGSYSILWPRVRRESRVSGTSSSPGGAALAAAPVAAALGAVIVTSAAE